MENLWYYKSGEAVFGPISTDELKRRLTDGRIAPDVTVKSGADGVWLRAGDAVVVMIPAKRATGAPLVRARAVAGDRRPCQAHVIDPIATAEIVVPPPPSPRVRWLCFATGAAALIGLFTTIVVVARWWSYYVVDDGALEQLDDLAAATECGPVSAPAAAGAESDSSPTVNMTAATVPHPPAAGATQPVEPPPAEARVPRDEPIGSATVHTSPKPDEPVAPSEPPAEAAAETGGYAEDADRQLARLDRIRRQLTLCADDGASCRKQIEQMQAKRREAISQLSDARVRLENMRTEARKYGDLVRRVRNELERRRQTGESLTAPISSSIQPETQTKITEFLVSEAAMGEQAYFLEQTIAEITPRLEVIVKREQALASTAEQALPEAFWLCDPFGRRPAESAKHVVEVSTRWIDGGDHGWLPRLVRGFALVTVGKYVEGLKDLKEARHIEERLTPIVFAARGWVLTKVGETHLASPDFEEAMKSGAMPGVVELFVAQSLVERRRYKDAEKHFALAMKALEDVAEARMAFAFFLATRQADDGASAKLAMQHAHRACELTNWENWMALDSLAIACAAAGDYTLAREWTDKAVEIAPAECTAMLRQRLELYATEHPLRIK